MVADRTSVTELATALGTLPYADLAGALAARSPVLGIDDDTWCRLDRLHASGAYWRDFTSAYRNGQAFAQAPDGLAGRPPRRIEWTGGHRPAGDEVAPIDLRIDHVYHISCKYLSANIANPSPARLFEGLLATTGSWDRTDWYETIAPGEYQDLYAACRHAAGLEELPSSAADLSPADRDRLRHALTGRRVPDHAQGAYRRLCAAVSIESAKRWTATLATIDPERMLWRLLRIGNAPYYLLGAHGSASLRLRIDTTWDWHHTYQVRKLSISAGHAGQPRVDWTAEYLVRASGETRRVDGHVEIRWSHGRFGQPPEAKIYLDSRIDHVPGYNPLEPARDAGQGRFFVT